MSTPHKNAEFIKAFADGKEVQFRFKDSIAGWFKNDTLYNFNFDHLEFRIKPEKKTIRYRVALKKDTSSVQREYYPDIVYSSEFEKHYSFIRWLTDWTEVEVDV